MSIELEGAVNRLTAATLTVATTIRQQQGVDYTQAKEDTQYAFNQHMRFIMHGDEDD